MTPAFTIARLPNFSSISRGIAFCSCFSLSSASWGQNGLLNKVHHYGKGAFNVAGKKRTQKGKGKGRAAWNKGSKMSREFCDKISQMRKGKPTTLGMKFPNQCGTNNVMNRPETKAKMSKIATGRKIAYREPSSRYWVYPTTSVSEQVGTISESNCA